MEKEDPPTEELELVIVDTTEKKEEEPPIFIDPKILDEFFTHRKHLLN